MLGTLLCKQFQTSRGSVLGYLQDIIRGVCTHSPVLELPSAPHGLGPAGSASALCMYSQNPCAHTALLHHSCPMNAAFPRIPRLFKLKMFFGSLFQQNPFPCPVNINFNAWTQLCQLGFAWMLSFSRMGILSIQYPPSKMMILANVYKITPQVFI